MTFSPIHYSSLGQPLFPIYFLTRSVFCKQRGHKVVNGFTSKKKTTTTEPIKTLTGFVLAGPILSTLEPPTNFKGSK